MERTGPLQGVKAVELAGIGPGPFAAMVLADMGAEVLRVDRLRPGPKPHPDDPALDPLRRGRRSVGVNLKHREGAGVVLRLAERAQLLIEGYRPGVAERLGVGPEQCLARNPRLVYGRMTGWGQTGPLAQSAGHDINYIALAGALDPIGRAGSPPTPPLNLLADFGGGGMVLAFGLVCALHEAGQSGHGQVVDAAMVDGAALLTSFIHGLRAMGIWAGERGANLLDTGAPFYDVYETADGKHVAVGALEPQFYAELLRRLGIGETSAGPQLDREKWPALRKQLAAAFRTRTRDEWCELLEGTDTCFAPVLSMAEAPEHPHNRARGTFAEIGGVTQPAPAPRFSRTPPGTPTAPARPGEHTEEALVDWGFTAEEVTALRESAVIG